MMARVEPAKYSWPPLAHGVLQLLFPSACAVCRTPHESRHGDIVCGVCLNRVVPLTHPLCSRCGHPRLSPSRPLPGGSADTGAPDTLPPCRWCERLPPYVRAARSVCRVDAGTGAELVYALKYSGWRAVARPMAQRMSRLPWPSDVLAERRAVVPLPLSTTRERERGYNQAGELARHVADAWHLPCWNDVVCRTRDTQSQVRLTPSERSGNVSHAFATTVTGRQRLRGAHIVLVDDVITTGASMNAAAEALIAGGARIVSYLTFGRAPDPGDRADSDSAFDQD